MIVKVIIILCIILCAVIVIGLAQTKVLRIYTLNYDCDFIVDDSGYVKLTIDHPEVKKESFWIEYNRYGSLLRRAVDNNDVLELQCYSSPLFSQYKIKEILYHNKRIV